MKGELMKSSFFGAFFAFLKFGWNCEKSLGIDTGSGGKTCNENNKELTMKAF